MGKGVSLETIAGGVLGLTLGVVTGAGSLVTGLYTLGGAAIGDAASHKYASKYQ